MNRRGAPRRMDMFPEQIQRLRLGLDTAGILPRGYFESNPMTRIPTLDTATSSNMNPFAGDKTLRDIVKVAEEMGLTTNNFDAIDANVKIPVGDGRTVNLVGGTVKSVSQSGKDLRMFHTFYRYLHGA